jgi:hypothetical protein
VRFLLILGGVFSAAFAIGVIGLVFFSTHGNESAGAAVSDAPAPRIALNGSSFDLGEVPADRIVERLVEFQNSGEEPLTVTIVKVRAAPDAACGCGVEGFEVRPKTVAPGGAGLLAFQLKVPEGMPDMEDKMVAELQTNDPAKPTIKISIIFRMAT